MLVVLVIWPTATQPVLIGIAMNTGMADDGTRRYSTNIYFSVGLFTVINSVSEHRVVQRTYHFIAPAFSIPAFSARAANSAAASATLPREMKLSGRSRQISMAVMHDTVTSHVTDLSACHRINVIPSGCLPSERRRPDGSLETWTPAKARDLATT